MKSKAGVCPICRQCHELFEARVYCSGKDFYGDCAIFICENCLKRCPKCGNYIVTPEIREYIKTVQKDCTHNPDGKCNLFACTCPKKPEKPVTVLEIILIAVFLPAALFTFFERYRFVGTLPLITLYYLLLPCYIIVKIHLKKYREHIAKHKTAGISVCLFLIFAGLSILLLSKYLYYKNSSAIYKMRLENKENYSRRLEADIRSLR